MKTHTTGFLYKREWVIVKQGKKNYHKDIVLRYKPQEYGGRWDNYTLLAEATEENPIYETFESVDLDRFGCDIINDFAYGEAAKEITKHLKQKNMQTLDVSLNNANLYEGCQIEEVAGRLNLTTPISEAVNIVGRNIAKMDLKGNEITLTGAMAVWSYLIVFHAVVHRFRRVYYDDGRSETVLVAAHG